MVHAHAHRGIGTRRAAAWIAVFAAIALPVAAQSVAPSSAPSTAPSVRPAAAELAGLRGFVANEGQWHERVRFFARSGRMELTVLDDALVFVPQRALGSDTPRPEPFVLRLPAAAEGGVRGVDALDTQHHFLGGKRSARHVRAFESVCFQGAGPGLDLVVRREATGFAYDLHLEPGADLGAFELGVEGSHGARLRDDGVLEFDTASGPLAQRIGASWEIDPATGERAPVASRFKLRQPASHGGAALGFEAPQRDPTRAFVLDPSLVYTTYVGGVGQELLIDMDVGPDGSAYLYAKSQPFAGTPTVPGAVQPESAGGLDVWIGRLSPDGKRLLWGTYLGGAATEEPGGVHLDTDGAVVVTGLTWSADFPVTEGVVQPVIGSSPDKSDLFVARIVPNGSALVWSTFYGGSAHDAFYGSALAPDGDVILSGRLGTPTPAATPGAIDTEWDSDDSAIIRLSADGSAVEFQTYFDAGFSGIDFDAGGNLCLVGGAFLDTTVTATPGAFQEIPAGGTGIDAVVTKFDPTGSSVLWLTFLGGTSSDILRSIRVDAADAIYIAGTTGSSDFPVTLNAFDALGGNGGGGVVLKLLPNGSDLSWSTYLSGCCGGVNTLTDLAVDAAGNVFAVGATTDASFPVTPDAFQSVFVGPSPLADAHLTKLDALGESLVYSTFFGGAGGDTAPQVGLDANQQPYLAFWCSSPDLPVTRDAFDSSYADAIDIAAAAFELPLLPWVVLGSAKAGAEEIPSLSGAGDLTVGSPTRLAVRGAAPTAPAWFVVGFEAIHLPFKGGTMVPEPVLLAPFLTSLSGSHDRSFPWIDVPGGIEFHIQAWVKDPGAFLGWSASNALRFTSQ